VGGLVGDVCTAVSPYNYDLTIILSSGLGSPFVRWLFDAAWVLVCVFEYLKVALFLYTLTNKNNFSKYLISLVRSSESDLLRSVVHGCQSSLSRDARAIISLKAKSHVFRVAVICLVMRLHVVSQFDLSSENV
jgi:hypothetical protein